MDRSRGDNVQEIYGAIAPMGGNGGSTSPAETKFFLSLKPDDFPTADFHQIWLRYVNPCPLANHRKRFSKIFRLRVTCLQKPQPKGRTAERVFTPRCSPRVRQCPNSGHFRSLYGLWDIKFSNFPFFCLFLPIKTPKMLFLYAAYSPGVTLQNASGYST